MNTFDDRKKAFESKYANDAEMQFKVMAKRNKFVGLWAANLLGNLATDEEIRAKLNECYGKAMDELAA